MKRGALDQELDAIRARLDKLENPKPKAPKADKTKSEKEPA